MKRFLSFLLTIAVLSVTLSAQVIYKNKGYLWKGNTIVQDKFTGKAVSAIKVTSNYVPIPPKMEVWNDMNPKEINRREWNLSVDIADLPQYTCSNVLENALYNMALEESRLAIEPDSTFRTGIAWGGVWTRDVSYSIIHSLAQLHPEVAMKSLRAKVTRNNRIIQDTGTGGAWPCSTDRVIWAVAAWEIYKVTGNKQWLNYIYPVIRNTLQDDLSVAYDAKKQLMRGETSYMDWREQEYPQWMEPADIYSSEATVNNAVHYMAMQSFVEICKLKGFRREAEVWQKQANNVKEGINKRLWMSDKGYYSIYLYGRTFPILADQTDAMGNALAILSGIADESQAKQISESQPCEPFGTPCIYPNLKDQYPYHNDATWPFVQGYWMRACAKVGNEQALLHSIAALYRGAALWLSNEENYEISTGDYQLTKLNSPRQLWSVAAQAAVVPHVYFGMEYEADALSFHPFVPKALKGDRVLKNFKYRQAVLNITMHGCGTKIKQFLVNGKPSEPRLDGDLSGYYTIDIQLADNDVQPMKINLVDNAYLPITPSVKLTGSHYEWKPAEGAVKYEILCNGKVVATTEECHFDKQMNGEIAIRGVSSDSVRGYICVPFSLLGEGERYMLAKCGEQPSDGYLDMTRTKNISVSTEVSVKEEGEYLLEWCYSNGAGSVTTENKCATRLMKVDTQRPVAVVFPQRGANEWEKWGTSNGHVFHLSAGKHLVTLEFTDQTENMNWDFNCVHVKWLNVQRVK